MELQSKKCFSLHLIVVFLLCSVLSHASHVAWQSDYESVRKQANQEYKNILVFLIEEDTKESNAIIKESFLNQKYIKDINKDFIAVIVRSHAKKSYPIELLYTTTYPALFFLSSEELFLCDPLEGIITPRKIVEKLSECH
ncbi:MULTISPECIES: thioredoxin family protein [Sulfurimonas]|uniref:thioredoxin family protein n=1 Tax=Sulfurimonas TaxID=202746 RepID=UPI0012644EC8|nr:thioredoxin family protein [Sulfurimonas indica]